MLEYDDVTQLHRLSVYELRENALCGHMNLDDYYANAIPVTVDKLLEPYFINELVNMDGVARDVSELTHKTLDVNDIMDVNSQLELRNLIVDYVTQAYNEKVGKTGLSRVDDNKRFAIVDSIDKLWVSHLIKLEQLKDAVGLRSYAQVQPLTEYQLESKRLFDDLDREIKIESVKKLFTTLP